MSLCHTCLLLAHHALFSCLSYFISHATRRRSIDRVCVDAFFFHVNRARATSSRSSGTQVAAVRESEPLVEKWVKSLLLRFCRSPNQDAYRLGRVCRFPERALLPFPEAKASESEFDLLCIPRRTVNVWEKLTRKFRGSFFSRRTTNI